ncbi:S1 family peptidase [Pseudomonas rubra]|uniref:Serine protease n=1 Tax=Pseudomonas rubra TaxID=2942627 RepID=A0ABT5P7L9_9PSED|nr:serine protease [Pseudomonas rubra]MDD1014014.1 serine protease [Pseudomonas rubra]MDD1038948.1 serine protease [Pseudomonas rubra]MDD1154298.1 serine protease [Pseudomonas rubra]
MFKAHTIYLGAILATATCQTLATDYGQGLPSPSAPLTLHNAQSQNEHWNGIGRLSDNLQCMASLIDSRDPWSPSDGPAYVVTSGHCVDQRNGVIVHDVPVTGSIAFNYFVDTLEQRQVFPLKRRVWSSMQGVDLALLELDASLQEVMAKGIKPLTLANTQQSGVEVLVLGDPINPGQGLRLAACTQNNATSVVEYPWVWRNVRSNNCQGIASGASGSPVVERSSNQVVAVLNTTTDTRFGTPSCGLNNPCTLDDGKAVDAPALNYAIPVGRLLGCFRDGLADLSLNTCHLLPGFQLEQQDAYSFKPLTKIATHADGSETLPAWNFSFSIDKPFYRYKTTRDPLACENPVGYSGTIASIEASIKDVIGPQPGWHFLCLLGVDSAAQRPSLALMGNSLSIAVDLLPAAPVPEPDMSVEPQDNGDIKVTWRIDPPDLEGYRVKRGPPGTTDCDDDQGYGIFHHDRTFTFKAAKLPLTLCSQAQDVIGQGSAVRNDLLQAPETSG